MCHDLCSALCVLFCSMTNSNICRHRFLVSIDKGVKVYKAIEIIDGKPTVVGWRTGKEVQRAHQVVERGGNLYVVSIREDRTREGERGYWSGVYIRNLFISYIFTNSHPCFLKTQCNVHAIRNCKMWMRPSPVHLIRTRPASSAGRPSSCTARSQCPAATPSSQPDRMNLSVPCCHH